MMHHTKTCTVCGDTDTPPYSKFVLMHGKPDGGKCKKCRNAYVKKTRLANGVTKRPQKQWNEQDKQELLRLYTIEKKVPSELGKQFGLSSKTICRVLDDLGVERTNLYTPVRTAVRINGKTVAEIEGRKRHKLKRLNRCREMVRQILQNTKCMDCSETDWTVLQFDHRDPSVKVMDIAELLTRGSINKLQEEIDKCDIVCANCHLRRTQKMFGSWRLKTPL